MKNKFNFHSIIYLLIAFMLIVFGSQKSYAQSTEKNSIRLKADYFSKHLLGVEINKVDMEEMNREKPKKR